MSKEYTKIKIPQYALVCKSDGSLARDGQGNFFTSNNQALIMQMFQENNGGQLLYEIKEFEPTIAELI